jgi:ABC-type sulfate/molybdate transport systems ATPase subunit
VAPLLNDISFKVPAKRMGLIYGRSGAGKTTLLQLVAGLQQPSSGHIALLERQGAIPVGHDFVGVGLVENESQGLTWIKSTPSKTVTP